jgi:hypothetical protein
MSNQDLVQTRRKQMDETNQIIERSKKTDQLGWITNELDTIHISVKKTSQLVRYFIFIA